MLQVECRDLYNFSNIIKSILSKPVLYNYLNFKASVTMSEFNPVERV
jgi:hypothetical protein